MASLLEGTLNTRTILPGRPGWLRSDAPLELTRRDVDFLLGRGVTTLVDLREAEKADTRPCCLANDSRFEVVNLPVTGGNAIPPTPDDVSRSYVNMVDAQMDRIIELVESRPGALWFCAAGKDRTGVVSALLMRNAGASREQIVENYLESGDNLRDALAAMAARNPSIDINVVTPQRRYMEEFLDWADEHGR